MEELCGKIVFTPEYRNPDALRGMEEFDYLWLIWEFSANKHKANSLMVRPPLLGGNTRMGVFATRSPFRPNNIGLSSVKIDSVEYDTPQGPVIHVRGGDLMDGTPIFDIKPYVTYADCHVGARSGFVDSNPIKRLEVEIPDNYAKMFSISEIEALRKTLALDPRPHYHSSPDKVYGMPFSNYDIHFKVADNVLKVVEIVKEKRKKRKQLLNEKMKVIIKTSLGDITVRLYDETPLHRDNFVKLAREGYYDGTLFHRVIKDFMIQGGDPDSKGAPAGKQLGIGGPDYTIEAEIKPTLFHKRGALAAARQGDEVNPERRSSGSQFYIVWGQVYNQGQIKQFAKQMEMQQMQQAFNALAMQHHEEIMQLRRDRNRAGLQELQDKLANEAQQQVKANGAGMTAEQQKIYTTIGGTPHLDGQYTVFGEVEEGLDIVDQIQQAATGRGDRPIEDIEMKMEVID